MAPGSFRAHSLHTFYPCSSFLYRSLFGASPGLSVFCHPICCRKGGGQTKLPLTRCNSSDYPLGQLTMTEFIITTSRPTEPTYLGRGNNESMILERLGGPSLFERTSRTALCDPQTWLITGPLSHRFLSFSAHSCRLEGASYGC